MNVDDLDAWLGRYGEAWETRDAEAAADLFSEDALYHQMPYEEPFRGRDDIRRYWSSVTADQREIDFDRETIGLANGIGVACWSSRFKLASTGARVELNGVFLLEFDADGRCTRLREWWHAR